MSAPIRHILDALPPVGDQDCWYPLLRTPDWPKRFAAMLDQPRRIRKDLVGEATAIQNRVALTSFNGAAAVWVPQPGSGQAAALLTYAAVTKDAPQETAETLLAAVRGPGSDGWSTVADWTGPHAVGSFAAYHERALAPRPFHSENVTMIIAPPDTAETIMFDLWARSVGSAGDLPALANKIGEGFTFELSEP